MTPTFYPAHDNSDNKACQEIRRQLEATGAKTDKWIVFQERIKTGKIGDYDFIVIIPDHWVIILEIKSSVGEIRFANCQWRKVLPDGHDQPLEYQPHEQCHKHVEHFINSVKKQLANQNITEIDRLSVYWGICFPLNDLDIDDNRDYGGFWGWQIYHHHTPITIDDFVRRLIKMAQTSGEAYAQKIALPKPAIKTLMTILNPTAQPGGKPALSVSANIITDDLNRSLKDIVSSYTDLIQNQHQPTLVTGRAGTGKTFLAAHLAKRCATNKQSTLLICFNKFLSRKLYQDLSGVSNYVTVKNWYQFLYQLIVSQQWPTKLTTKYQAEITALGHKNFSDPTLFSKMPSIVFEGLLENNPNASLPRYQHIIVDEAQDILGDQLDREDCNATIIKESLAPSGTIHLFADNWQTVNALQTNGSNIDFNAKFGYQNSPFYSISLGETNYRNPQVSIKALNRLFGLNYHLPPSAKNDFSGEIFHFTSNKPEKSAQKLRTELQRLLADKKVDHHEITILSHQKFNNSIASRLSDLITDNYEQSRQKESKILFSTIRQYKGLENKYIFIVDIDSYQAQDRTDIREQIMYVALSRANAYTWLFDNQIASQQLLDYRLTMTELPNSR